MNIEWREAAGSCGLNVGQKVHAAYASGIGLFSFENVSSTPDQPFFSCVVVGHCSCGGSTLDEAKAAGEKAAREADPRDADEKMTKAQFKAVVENSVILQHPSRNRLAQACS